MVPRPAPVAVPTTIQAGTRTTKKASAAPATTAAPAVSADTEAAAAVAAPEVAYTDGARSGGTSTTNVQEAGVDEGDEVETDGRYVYTAIGNGAVRVIDTTTAQVVATIPDPMNTNSDPQLILDGTRLAVVRNIYSGTGPETVVELWSVLNPPSPQLIGRTHLEGSVLAVRSVDHRARIVLTTGFGQRLPFVRPAGNTQQDFDRATTANKAIVKKASAAHWLPRIYDETASGGVGPVRQALDCREVGKPADPSGLGIVWVATVDLETSAPRAARGSGGVVTDGGAVYSSAATLYVSTVDTSSFVVSVNAKGEAVNARGLVVRRPDQFRTALHAFDLRRADGATYLASGSVPGTLLSQFSMSEYNGVLRVATTTQRTGFGTQQSSGVHLLTRSGRTISEISSVTGLGVNEQIRGVRFLGELGYVVTFRQTDPLYVLDLRNPHAPRVAGELKIPGYSAYLHPLEPGYILGVGQDATDTGRALGTMLQVFDVRDPSNPKQVAKLRVGGSTEAEYDHHAFLWWPATRNAFVPVTDWRSSSVFSGMVVARVDLTAVTEQGRISHEVNFDNRRPFPVVVAPVAPVTPVTTVAGQAAGPVVGKAFDQVRRAMIVNGRLVTIGYQSVKVSDLTTLQQQLYGTFG